MRKGKLQLLHVRERENYKRKLQRVEKGKGKKNIVEIKNEKKAAVITDCPPSGRSSPMMRSWGLSTAV